MYILAILSVLYTCLCVQAQNTNEFTLNIVHLNDFHARFEETSVFSGRCSPSDASKNNCYGGFARLKSKLDELRRTKQNVIFMAAGDYFQGTVWYTIHKWKAMAHFLNLIGQDVMSVGNHEFDDGINGLVPFLDNVTFPVLAANIDDSLEPSIRGKIIPSLVLERGGRKIGIVGYVTTETEVIANPGKVRILDEVEHVRRESRKLRQSGVNIIIALGHAGFRKDLDIAKNVEDVDVVVGGHTNTFLYSGTDPSIEKSMGEYPSIVKQSSGKRVLVVQAYAFGKYLGELDVTFNEKGDVVSWVGNPILMDNSVPQDPMILRELVPWRESIQSVVMETIGRTFVFLDGNRQSCRMKECNLGNLETDAIVHQNAKYPDDMEWALTSLAVINGGGIRASIDERSSNGSISMEDVLAVAPFQNTIDIVELKGSHIKEMFEHSVRNYDPVGIDLPGGFLQVSGFHLVYDISKPPGSRVVSIAVRCASCRIPEYEPLREAQVYKVAMPSFIANGGDGYAVVRDNKINHHLTGLLDTDVISQYIRLYSPIYQGIENRILFLQSSEPCTALSDPPIPSNSSSIPTTLAPPASSSPAVPLAHVPLTSIFMQTPASTPSSVPAAVGVPLLAISHNGSASDIGSLSDFILPPVGNEDLNAIIPPSKGLGKPNPLAASSQNINLPKVLPRPVDSISRPKTLTVPSKIDGLRPSDSIDGLRPSDSISRPSTLTAPSEIDGLRPSDSISRPSTLTVPSKIDGPRPFHGVSKPNTLTPHSVVFDGPRPLGSSSSSSGNRPTTLAVPSKVMDGPNTSDKSKHNTFSTSLINNDEDLIDAILDEDMIESSSQSESSEESTEAEFEFRHRFSKPSKTQGSESVSSANTKDGLSSVFIRIGQSIIQGERSSTFPFSRTGTHSSSRPKAKSFLDSSNPFIRRSHKTQSETNLRNQKHFSTGLRQKEVQKSDPLSFFRIRT